MQQALVPYTDANVRSTVAALVSNPDRIQLPDPYLISHFNNINAAARAVLSRVDVMTERARTLQFLSTMCSASHVTPKQRKWLADLVKKHLVQSA